MAEVSVAVIGGSGLYDFLDDSEAVEVSTPYGPHSAGLTLGRMADRDVAFLPRHGLGHRHLPHSINYRANLWAVRRLGAEQVLAPCAVGSLQPEVTPGSFVVPDQLVDRTHGRAKTFGESGAFHVSFADPYCPAGRSALITAVQNRSVPVVPDGTMVVIQGPRFSTRAESQAFSRAGWSLVNMTGMPEAVLARELAMCYSSLALVTDFDAGVDPETAVSQAEVFAVFERNISVMREVLAEALEALPRTRTCSCPEALAGLSTDHVPVSGGDEGIALRPQ